MVFDHSRGVGEGRRTVHDSVEDPLFKYLWVLLTRCSSEMDVRTRANRG